MRQMAKKKKLGSTGEGTSSSTKPTGTSVSGAHSVNPTLKLSDVQTLADTKPTDLVATKSKRKRKAPHEKTPSPPKRRKTTTPLLTGPLDPNVHVVDRLQFNLNAEERKPFKGMTPSESFNIAYELIARASVCLNYTVGTTKPLLVAELEAATKDLEAARKENTTLSLRIEEITNASEDERLKAADNLKKVQGEVSSLQRSVDDLKLDLQKATAKHEELVKERDAAITERDNLRAENESLGDEVFQERQLGFEQGIA